MGVRGRANGEVCGLRCFSFAKVFFLFSLFRISESEFFVAYVVTVSSFIKYGASWANSFQIFSKGYITNLMPTII